MEFNHTVLAALAVERPAHWPEHVYPISQDHLAYLGFDTDGNLYWDGSRLEIKQPLSLTWLQASFGITAAISTAVIGVIELIYFTDRIFAFLPAAS